MGTPRGVRVGGWGYRGTPESPRGTHNAAAGDPWMDRWMDGGGTFMASVSRGQSHFAREHSKRWHTKNPRCLATWANFSCFWLLLLITIGPKPIWTRILHFLSFLNCTSYVLSVRYFFYSSRIQIPELFWYIFCRFGPFCDDFFWCSWLKHCMIFKDVLTQQALG